MSETLHTEYQNFITENLGLKNIRVPLFYKCPVGLRFDLQVESTNPVNGDDSEYFKNVELRANNIFESCFSPEDEVICVYQEFCWKRQKIRPNNTFFKCFYNLEKSKIKYHKASGIYDSTDKDDRWNIALIKCKVKDFDHKLLLRGIANTDFGLRTPQILGEVFILNLTQKFAFNMYDDRGLDVVAKTTDILQGLYEKHSEWLLEYDIAQMEKVFGEKRATT